MTTPPRSRRVLALTGALGLAASTPAAATPPPAVALHTSACPPEDDAALRRALAIELEALDAARLRAHVDTASAPAPLTLQAECDPHGGSVALRVWASEPRLVLRRVVALRDVDEPARARTLALVISEALGPTLAGEPREGEPLAAPAGDTHGARRRFGVYRANPYGDVDARELFTTSNPYGMGDALRIGGAAQARLSMRDGSVLLGGELGLNAPLSEHVDATLELSYSAGPSGPSALPSGWLSMAVGADLVHYRALGLSVGPRLSVGHLSVSPREWDPATERTLVTQLGVQSTFELPVGERLSLLMTLGAQRTLGVYALTRYTGLDDGFKGWMASWGLGLGVGP